MTGATGTEVYPISSPIISARMAEHAAIDEKHAMRRTAVSA
jgi:hypothetical protein